LYYPIANSEGNAATTSIARIEVTAAEAAEKEQQLNQACFPEFAGDKNIREETRLHTYKKDTN
jgi:hypothetical protein